MKSIRGMRWALPLAIVLAMFASGTAAAHQAKSITASAVCGGATTVTVKADVWGGIHLIVKVDNVVIHDAAENGNDQSIRTFVYQTNTAPGGHSASARTSDQQGSVGTEFNTPQPCPTPTPSPKPTPTPTPTATPSPTPTATPTPTPTPTGTPRVTPPPSATPSFPPNLTLPPTAIETPVGTISDAQTQLGVVILFLVFVIGLAIFLTRGGSARNNYRD